MLLEPDELKKSSAINPEVFEFTEKNPSPPLDWSDATALKSLMVIVTAANMNQLGPAESSIEESERQIPMRDGYESTIKIHKPASKPSAGSPLVVLIFGGGFVSGAVDQMTPQARALVRQFSAVAVNISYRLGPENKWPVPSNDAWDSLKWVAAHAAELGADPSKGFIVGGISAGATHALALTNLSLQEKLDPPLTGQYLCIPGIMDAQHVPEKYKEYFLSREHNAHAPILDAAALNALTAHLEWDDMSPLRFPVLFQDKIPLSSLPPTYFQVCGMDPIRDDGLIYEEMLKEAGAKTKMDFYPGCPHGHWAFMPGIEVSNKALGETMVGFGWLLGKELSVEDGLGAMMPKAA
ncbi:hypothetical protein B0A55_07573 [Friedmanniomyces simplex]|uniref:Alpha/beta hydrolase fold-3 domain-containing protein n=1 Tax=Friedmanniomyces simplex TaxID=329884 RepID=A0A4U0X7C5_9PEZI|nr:hypothetical protein B0A55_07573 [Friedmanniomyces simplex]